MGAWPNNPHMNKSGIVPSEKCPGPGDLGIMQGRKAWDVQNVPGRTSPALSVWLSILKYGPWVLRCLKEGKVLSVCLVARSQRGNCRGCLSLTCPTDPVYFRTIGRRSEGVEGGRTTTTTTQVDPSFEQNTYYL